VRRGLYAPVPLSSLPTDQLLEDPWAIVPQLFSAAYIGAATAAHHWDLTEQLFRSVFVYSAKLRTVCEPTSPTRTAIQLPSWAMRNDSETAPSLSV